MDLRGDNMDKEKIIKLMDTRPTVNDNDYCAIHDYWNKLASLFTVTEDETIEFLNSLDDVRLVYASEVFDELIDIYNTESFIKKLKELSDKRSDLYLL